MSEEEQKDQEEEQLYQKIQEEIEALEASDKHGLDVNVIVESLDEQIAEKKEEIKMLRQLRKRARPSLWRRLFR